MPRPPKRQIKILYLDIETTPNLSYTWGKYQQNVIAFKQEWYLLCCSWAWGDEKKTIHNVALPHFPAKFNKDKTDDFEVVKEIHSLLDEADIVVTRNGDRFDLKKIAARFIYHGLKPVSPYKSIDTVKLYRRFFAFNSNKLDDVAAYLQLGIRKLKYSGGVSLWFDCMNGVDNAWSVMRRYNDMDVKVLMKIYDKLKAFYPNHPNLNHYSRHNRCPVCESQNFFRAGFRYLKSGKKQMYRCSDCGHYFDENKLVSFH